MIISVLLSIVYGFVLGVSLIVSSFGEVTPNSNITSAVAFVSSYYSTINTYFPVDQILLCVAVLFTFDTAVFLYKLVRWAYQKVPGIN